MKRVVSGESSFQRLGDMGAVDVGDEVGARAVLAVGLEGFGDHDGAEVGAADADVDEVGDFSCRSSLSTGRSGRLRRIPACVSGRG